MSEQAEQDVRYYVDRLRSAWAKAKRTGDLHLILQALYDHEINCGMSSFWDNGWDVWIGDEMNGYRAERNFRPEEFDLIAQWLIEQTERLYPAVNGGL